jgi:hypothetical protein
VPPRADVVSGHVTVIEAGDGTLHCVERRYLRPELHSLMQVDRPTVTAADLDRVVVWVNEPLSALQGTLISRYIKWGSKQTFASKKSKPSQCSALDVHWAQFVVRRDWAGAWNWFLAHGSAVPSYHPANPEGLPCNHNLLDIHLLTGEPRARRALIPILNSTLIAFIKSFYGRYAGTEGNLKTEVVDVVMLEIPDPRRATEAQVRRLESALARIQQRKVTHLVEKEGCQETGPPGDLL